MKANLIHMGNIFMAGVAVTLRRVGYQVHVGCFLFLGVTITTVADNATYLTVCAQDELGIFEEDLFPYLQRR
jgi:hypothetical protein